MGIVKSIEVGVLVILILINSSLALASISDQGLAKQQAFLKAIIASCCFSSSLSASPRVNQASALYGSI